MRSHGRGSVVIGWRFVTEATVDSRRRMSLGKVGVSGRYKAYENADGEILLVPVVSVPRAEVQR